MTNYNSARELYARFHQLNTEIEELPDIVREKQARVENILALSCPWSYWYQIPWKQLLGLFIILFGLEQGVIKASKSDTPTQALFDFLDANPDPINDDELSDEDKAFCISIFMCIMHQLSSISIFSRSMSDLVEAAKYDDDALFDAVIVDRTVIANPVIAHRIQIAQLTGDESFMNKLAKAITRTRPRRPNSQYDDLRYMLLAIDEMSEYRDYTVKDKYDLLAVNLELMDSENKRDAFEAFKKLERRLRSNKGTSD